MNDFDRIGFENVQKYKDASSEGLITTWIHLSNKNGNIEDNVDCLIAINHTDQNLEIRNEGPVEFFDEMKQYFAEKLGAQKTDTYWIFKLSKYDKASVADALEGLDDRIKVLILNADYKK